MWKYVWSVYMNEEFLFFGKTMHCKIILAKWRKTSFTIEASVETKVP